MCTYLAKRGATYYFRRAIPVELRPAFGGRAEFMVSLRSKDRAEAKLRIPAHTVETDKLLADATRSLAGKPAPKPKAPLSPAQIERGRTRWEAEQAQADHVADELFATDMKAEALSPIMDALSEGREPEGSLADIARAGRLLVEHEREKAGADIAALRSRYGQSARALVGQPQAVECGPATASGLYLDKDILDRWATERGVVPKGKDTHRAVAEWFYARTERKPVERITRQDVLAFKDKLLAEGQSVANTNMKLSRLRTLLGWAYQNDLASANVAEGISVKVADSGKGKRLPFALDELQAIFASPVYANGERPKGGKGEAAYWLPLLGLFTGACCCPLNA